MTTIMYGRFCKTNDSYFRLKRQNYEQIFMGKWEFAYQCEGGGQETEKDIQLGCILS